MDPAIVPQPAPTLEGLWADARAGRIEWSAVQQHQADMMPRCINHGERSAPVYWDEKALCEECFAKAVIVKDVQASALSPEEALAAWKGQP